MENKQSLSSYLLFDIQFNFVRRYKQLILNSNEFVINKDLKNKKKMIVMQTPNHGNLGDQAIAYAQKKFIKDHFKDYTYLEVSFNDVVKGTKNIQKVLNDEDIIFIHGGGNMGDMYLNEEYIRRYIIKKYKNNKIVSFPQTISFSSNYIGKKELKKTQKIYKNCQNLVLIAREMKSYLLMKKYFDSNQIILTPDIVLSLDKRTNSKRKGVLTCFRSDQEKVMNTDFKSALLKKLKDEYQQVTVSDTVVNNMIFSDTRDIELNKIWSKFKQADVVLTDRLHGMIFCVITGTPCIVFKNANHKIEASYNDWLQSIHYIKFIDTNDVKIVNEVMEVIEKVKKASKENVKYMGLKESFLPLINDLNKYKENDQLNLEAK
ncbi:MAG: polysaccharide pyruvyl transferase family protein [Bacillus sp. (in: firmicutes)]